MSVPRLQPGWLLWGFRIVLAVVVTLASSCGGGDMTGPTPSVPTPSVPTSLTISPQAVTLSWIGEPAQLSVEVRDQNGNVMAGQAVAWSSTNPAVATVATGGPGYRDGCGPGGGLGFIRERESGRARQRHPSPTFDD